MKTLVTITRTYKKELNFYVEEALLEGLTKEQIGDFMISDFEVPQEKEDLLQEQELEPSECNEDTEDGDRYDIYDDKGILIYGGHL